MMICPSPSSYTASLLPAVPISPEGWMLVSDALGYVNATLPKLTQLPPEWTSQPYGEGDVRAEVAHNPKQRFQLNDTLAGLFIRAAQVRVWTLLSHYPASLVACFLLTAEYTLHPRLFILVVQGHSMKGVGEDIGVPLDRKTAPEFAVHGTYLRFLDTILNEVIARAHIPYLATSCLLSLSFNCFSLSARPPPFLLALPAHPRWQGLSRMGRHHVHLARGLLGEAGVVSGMRLNTEVYVWVAVHKAMDSGIRFYETSNGVILCEGFNGLLTPQVAKQKPCCTFSSS